MKKETLVIIADYSEESFISIQELYEACHISPDFVNELIEYEIIHPHGEPNEWSFNLAELQKIKTAVRLQHDLEVNLPGVAIVLDLLKELKELRGKIELLEKHLLK